MQNLADFTGPRNGSHGPARVEWVNLLEPPIAMMLRPVMTVQEIERVRDRKARGACRGCGGSLDHLVGAAALRPSYAARRS
jgi:hypothetical protein